MQMIRRLIVLGAAAAATVVFSASALAYQGSSGASVTTCDSHVAPGGSTCVNATFTTNGSGTAGQQVTFSTDRGGGQGCTVAFSRNPSSTDSSGTATTTASFGTACHGSVQICATDASTSQSACASVTVNSGNGGGGGNGHGNGHSTTTGGNGQTSVKGAKTSQGNGSSGGSHAVAAVIGASGAALLVLLALGLAVLRRRLGGVSEHSQPPTAQPVN